MTSLPVYPTTVYGQCTIVVVDTSNRVYCLLLLMVAGYSVVPSEGAFCLGDHILFRILTYFYVFLFSLHYKLFRFHLISVVYHVI